MRDRLVLAFVGLTLAVIGLYGIPRAYFLADLVHDHTAETLRSSSTAMAALVAEREKAGDPVDEELLGHGLSAADRVSYVAPGGGEVAVGGQVDPDGALVDRRRLAGGGTLTLTVSADTVNRGVQEAIVPLLLLGAGLAVFSAILGFVLARRLSRPFQSLAEAARQLGHGRFDVDVPAYSVPEARAIGSSLRGAGAQLEQLVRREREFAVNASHQLRTPITALRLGLEDLTLWPETTPAVREELGRSLLELDRLNAAIGELLDLARGRRLGDQADIDLAALVAATARRWQAPVEQDGRRIVVRSPGVVRARLATGPVEQVLDVLIDNARLHGHGDITVETRNAGSHLEVSVADEGDRRLGSDIFQRGVTSRTSGSDGHGVGLAVASELAEVSGGHLSLDTAAARTRFVLWLPAPRLPQPVVPASS